MVLSTKTAAWATWNSVSLTTRGAWDWNSPTVKQRSRSGTISQFKALAGMINVYYDYALTEECSLYLGAGLGVAQCGYNSKDLTLNQLFNVHNNNKLDLTKTVFAWQVMAGLGYEINENWTVEAGYKLFNTSKIKAGNTNMQNGKNSQKTPFCHAIELGLRYNF